MADSPNPYDTIAYPSLIFRDCRPDRLATLARLHGLSPPAIDTARMLEIGGGDGLNVMALAAAHPRAEFRNIDLAAEPVERGAAAARAAGMTNVRHEVLDLMDAPERLSGQFDYIVAHGVYAWVPDVVRKGLMVLLQRLLSPTGVAYLSYNAMPGGHSRMALRDMILHHISHITVPRERIAATRKLLTAFVQPQANDEPITTAMRKEAEATLAQSDGQMFHDQLGPNYAPQSLSAVCAAAAEHGLRYLGDATLGGQDQGFVDPEYGGITDAALIGKLQSHDYRRGRYFRKSLFVRADQPIKRVLDYAIARGMWASSHAVALGDGRFRFGRAEGKIGNPHLTAIVERLIACKPGRTAVSDLTDDPQLLSGLSSLALAGYIDLHTAPAPFTAAATDRPLASPLARMQIARGAPQLVTLDHAMLSADEPLRQALLLMDGMTDRAELSRKWQQSRWSGSATMDGMLAKAAAAPLLLA
jgi:SAM-dependent methyltransferase